MTRLTSATQVNPGDKVRCVEPHLDSLVEGEIYTIKRRGRLNSTADADAFVMIEERPNGGWLISRFELFQTALAAEPTFKPGDKVRCINATGIGALTKDAVYTVRRQEPAYRSGGTDRLILQEFAPYARRIRPMVTRFEPVAERTHLERVRELVGRITPPARRRFRVATNEHGMVYLQVEGKVRDLTDPLNPGPTRWQRGTKAYISEHAVDSEVFQCALSLLITFDEHETREAFLVDGKRVFGPHIRTEALKSVCDDTETRH